MEETSFISVRDLVFTYSRNSTETSKREEIRALAGVSFDVEKGEFLAIIGKNGSGKSTLAKCLNALFLPESGTVRIKGMDTRDGKHTWDIRQTCGMVFQNPDNQIVSSIVEDDVAFGPENIGVEPKEIRSRVDAALGAVDMREAARKAPHLLSGGQKQKIAIAGVVAMKPECIVFDEPTAMLDPKGRQDIMEVIDSLHQEGITVILITHFMDETVDADRILLMDKGEIVGEGTPQELFNDGRLLREHELDLPLGASMAAKLRGEGVPVPEEVITTEELTEFLMDYKG